MKFVQLSWFALATIAGVAAQSSSGTSTGPAPPLPAGFNPYQTGNCTQYYGDYPAEIIPPDPSAVLSNTQATDGQAELAYLQQLHDICQGVPGATTAQILTYTDNDGTARAACFITNDAATSATPLPLLVWIHPSIVTADITFFDTNMQLVQTTQPLNNENPGALGFHILLPISRNIYHHYPAPFDNEGVGWDNWYRNYNRGTSGLNVDVETIDYFITEAKNLTAVDERRVFLGGWSNGAAMGLQYAINTPSIASGAFYSAPDQTRDSYSAEFCPQIPNPQYATPTMDVHNYCDIAGICITGKYYYDDLQYRWPNAPHQFVVIDGPTQTVLSTNGNAVCDPTCGPGTNQANTEGDLAHFRWPNTQNALFFNFWLANPLPANADGSPQQWPTLSTTPFVNYPRGT